MKLPITDDQLVAYALGELDADAKSEIDQALKRDPQLADRFNEFVSVKEETESALASLATDQSLGDERTKSIAAHISSIETSDDPRPKQARMLQPLHLFLVAAGVCLIAGGVWFISQPSYEELRSVRLEIDSLSRHLASYDPPLLGNNAETDAPPAEPLASPSPLRIGNHSELERLRGEFELLENRLNAIAEARNRRATAGDQPGTSEIRYELRLSPQSTPESTTEEVVLRRRRTGSNDQLEHLEALGYIGGGGATSTPRPQVPNAARDAKSWYPDTAHESYDGTQEHTFRTARDAPLSTFSIDVDTASYSNARRFLMQRQLPPVDSIRIEEFVNYFDYAYPQPTDEEPFSTTVDVAESPFNERRWIARIGLQGKSIRAEDRGPANLVFLLDVSGSMRQTNKLPLVQQAMRLLSRQLRPDDRVAIVTYSGDSRVALPSTFISNDEAIENAINELQAGGSTNGSAGIQEAYQIAREHFVAEGLNRVILATDGDFNVGIASPDELEQLIKREATSGVFLTVLGFGMGNLKDDRLETLADNGNGNYAYVDSFAEARKVFVEDITANLMTIAKDVKIQVEFNPARIRSYRLLGYENRALANRDFNDDTKDAGEIGAGHSVTALYELIPAGAAESEGVDDLRYETPRSPEPTGATRYSNELMTVKLRYKAPDGDLSKKIEQRVYDEVLPIRQAPGDLQFAAGIAGFAMMLKNSPEAANLNFPMIVALLEAGLEYDSHGHRAESMDLVRIASEVLGADLNVRNR